MSAFDDLEQDVEDLQSAQLDQADQLTDHETRLGPVEDFLADWSDLDPSMVGHLQFPLTQDDIDLINSAVGAAVHGYQVFTGNGTFTVPTGVTKFHVKLVGGGGAGGAGGGGGGAGGYSESFALDLTGVVTVTVTIGSGGNGVTSGNGQNGGNSSFGSYMTANGGIGGSSSGNNGGTATGGDVNIQGQPGRDLFQISTGGLGTSHENTGDGGSNPLGLGGRGHQVNYGSQANGSVGTGYGAGGSGGFNDAGSAIAGGPGTGGVCIIIW